MTSYRAAATIPLDHAEAEALAERLCGHLESHKVRIERDGARRLLAIGNARGIVAVEPEGLSLHAEAATLPEIAAVKNALAGHLVEFAPHLAAAITWSGDGADLAIPPEFRIMTVTATHDVTPHMRRLTLAGEDLQRYADMANLHVRLLFPAKGDAAPRWPFIGANGVSQYPSGEGGLASRKYTIRTIDAGRGVIEIDFVMHEDAGPGAAFAAHARPGDVVGMAGPGGRSAPLDRDWYLLAGDETALPAISRILEALPENARGVALVEVADERERQHIDFAAAIDLRWLHRDGRPAGTLLPPAVRELALPRGEDTIFAWVGCEHQAFRAIRAYLREERSLARDQQLVVSYWRNGEDQESAQELRESDAPRPP